MNLTEKEKRVLNAIANNHYSDELGDSIWSDCINESNTPSGIEGKELSGVVSSLCKKGLLDDNGLKKDNTIWLTKKGVEYFNNKTKRKIHLDTKIKYKIQITTEEGELLETIEIDPQEAFWDSSPTRISTANDIFDEINRDIKRRKS